MHKQSSLQCDLQGMRLRDCFRYQIPYFVIGHGIVGPPDPSAEIGARPSDEELCLLRPMRTQILQPDSGTELSTRPGRSRYLLFAATEYVLSTKDVAFLGESVTAYNSTLNRTVLGCLVDSYKYLMTHIGLGDHGLLRMQTGDWNDVFVYVHTHSPPKLTARVFSERLLVVTDKRQ